jgi:NTP pyrophosphatase (non-canonical NTP hydrolase)
MNFEQYTKEAERTSAILENETLNNLHYLLGMITEIGELLDIWKRNIAYKKDIDWINVKEELGDILWYFSNFLRINNIDFEEILNININKLKSRYPEKFTEENAINRDLESERKILES